MARERSIPRTLELSILRRWTAGQSLNTILEWIRESNRRRAKPVHTSRSSIDRMIARYETPGTARSSVATVHRLRRQAPANAERLEEIQAAYRRLGEEADTIQPDMEPAALAAMRARHALKRSALQREEIAAQRSIRLAGLGGAQARQALQENAAFDADAREALEGEIGAEVLEEHVEEETEQELAQHGLTEPALVASVVAAQEASESDTKASRLDPEKSDGPCGSEPGIAEPLRPFVALPFLRPLPWKLSRAEAADWERQRERINHWLVIAAHHGVPTPPPEEQPSPGETVADQVVPVMAVPDWRLTPDQRAHLDEQTRRANRCLHWLRGELHRRHPPEPVLPPEAPR